MRYDQKYVKLNLKPNTNQQTNSQICTLDKPVLSNEDSQLLQGMSTDRNFCCYEILHLLLNTIIIFYLCTCCNTEKWMVNLMTGLKYANFGI